MSNRIRLSLLAVVAALGCFALSAMAQVQPQALQAITPMTRDAGALITLTARGAGTVNSVDQTGFNVTRIICVLNQSSHTGTPSTTFVIQNKDKASGLYYNLLTSAATTADNTPQFIFVGPDVTATANVSAVAPIARTWRVQAIVAGTSPVVTGTVGCSVQ